MSVRNSKTDVIEAVAVNTGVSKATVKSVVNAALDVIAGMMANGDAVQFAGFGTFEPRERAARTGKNPKTGEPIKIAASIVPAFKAGKALKEMVNNGAQ